MITNKFAADHVVSGQPVSVLKLEQIKGNVAALRTEDRLWTAVRVYVKGAVRPIWKLTGDYVTC